MNYFTRPLMVQERKYTFRSCTDIEVRSGLIGYETVNMSDSFTEVNKQWTVVSSSTFSEFEHDFSEIKAVIGLLFPNKESLRVYYNSNNSLAFSFAGVNYVGSIFMTDKFSYLVRIAPSKNELTIWCYISDRLKHHIKNALRGICFVNEKNEELATIPDGGAIVLHPSKINSPITCRYIDPFTALIGAKVWKLNDLGAYLKNKGMLIIPT